MLTRIIWKLAMLLFFSTAAFASCAENDDHPSEQDPVVQFIPQAPDYSDTTMWVTADGDTEGTGADIFYVVSTWEDDWTTEDGRI